ncbi:unnamed protein product [Gongylonema pulchrum]|uniref:Fibronectin type-III domain-containing protein n=1 Tax=Gongylonema pulchrum TaxID=637853 RepID=A0A183D5A7_9BILA|nr:unnamed protein product [Gongylonema pulchrum]
MLPTNITFYIAREDKVNGSDFEPNSANVTFEYSGNQEFRIYQLEPKSRYKIRAQATNEAGVSELSDPELILTTAPWTPEAPNDINYDCSKACSLVWDEPNDRGSPIIAYKLILKEITLTEPVNVGTYTH